MILLIRRRLLLYLCFPSLHTDAIGLIGSRFEAASGLASATGCHCTARRCPSPSQPSGSTSRDFAPLISHNYRLHSLPSESASTRLADASRRFTLSMGPLSPQLISELLCTAKLFRLAIRR